jgi:hypothetical protein
MKIIIISLTMLLSSLAFSETRTYELMIKGSDIAASCDGGILSVEIPQIKQLNLRKETFAIRRLKYSALCEIYEEILPASEHIKAKFVLQSGEGIIKSSCTCDENKCVETSVVRVFEKFHLYLDGFVLYNELGYPHNFVPGTEKEIVKEVSWEKCYRSSGAW